MDDPTDPVTPAPAPPGWYPDPPASPGGRRYWDGVQWTEHVAPAAAPESASHGIAQPPSIGAEQYGRILGRAIGMMLVVGWIPLVLIGALAHRWWLAGGLTVLWFIKLVVTSARDIRAESADTSTA